MTCRCLSARHLVSEAASGHRKEMGINYECASYTTKSWLVFIQEENVGHGMGALKGRGRADPWWAG